jgi:hypothetical protein
MTNLRDTEDGINEAGWEKAMTRQMYAVATRHYGRKLITSGGINNPMGGLLDYPKSVWTQITKRPIGLERAIALANAQDTYATVQPWGMGETTYYNGKAPLVPAGWYPSNAQTAQDSK